MPARSNDFQRIVKYIYDQISDGATVTESGMLLERDGTQREIDILVEWKFSGTSFQMAIECRDHNRQQNVQWVDQLIGKFRDLRVNKVIAVSSSKFTLTAKKKAYEHGIEVITVNEALTRDWRVEIERWKMMTHSFTLLRIIATRPDGEIFSFSEVTADGKTATHRDQISEHLYNFLQPFFFKNLSKYAANIITAKIAERWQDYIDDPTPRYMELIIDNPGLTKDQVPLDISEVVFGIGTLFHIGIPNNHFALSEHVLSDVVIETMSSDIKWKFIFVPRDNQDENGRQSR